MGRRDFRIKSYYGCNFFDVKQLETMRMGASFTLMICERRVHGTFVWWISRLEAPLITSTLIDRIAIHKQSGYVLSPCDQVLWNFQG